MCGILAIISKNKVSNEIRHLSSTITHRGPDHLGLYERNLGDFFSGIAHSRLSILDTSAKGNQPMFYKNLLIVFNGEIYNFKDIKKTLVKEGYEFYSNSDTEVVLKSFHFWGKDCVEHLDGMYAFSVIDYNNSNVYLFRDRFGVKPIYFYFDHNHLIFSSEAKSILKSSFFKKNLNHSAVQDFLNLGYLKNENRIFKNLFLLKNSSYVKFSFSKNKIKIEEEKILNIQNKNSIKQIEKEDDALEYLKSILINSCKKRLISDVPVGLFLSGGIDSSLIAAIIKKEIHEDIPAFTLSDKKAGSIDYEISKKISNFLKIDHFFYDLDENKKNIYNTFENLSSFVDEPFADISFVSTSVLSREVKKRVKVVISGDGADELFGGYPKYSLLMNRYNLIKKFYPLRKEIIKFLGSLIKYFPRSDNLKYKKFFSHLMLLNEKNLIEIYNSFCLSEIYLKNDFIKKTVTDNNNTSINLSYENLLLEDQKGYLVDNILFKLDRSTMCCGLEGREPFLDQDIKDFSDKYSKFDFFKNKKLLKRLHSKYFGKDFYNYKLPKQGFSAKYSSLINNDTKKFTDTLFDKSFLKKQNIFDYSNLETLYRKNSKNERDLKLIYLISCFQIWYQKWM